MTVKGNTFKSNTIYELHHEEMFRQILMFYNVAALHLKRCHLTPRAVSYHKRIAWKQLLYPSL